MGMVAILSCDLDRLNKLSFPHPMEAPLTIDFDRRVDDRWWRQQTTEAYLSYKLTCESSVQVS